METVPTDSRLVHHPSLALRASFGWQAILTIQRVALPHKRAHARAKDGVHRSGEAAKVDLRKICVLRLSVRML